MFIHKFKNKDPILSLVPSHPPIIPPPPPPLPFTPIIKYNIYYNNKIMQINLEYYMRYTIQTYFPVNQTIIQLNSQYDALYILNNDNYNNNKNLV